MADALLVHGAWQGAWAWERFRPLLEERGHRVATPTLAGSGARASELSPELGLQDHVADVLDAAAPLDRFTLVVHSYAGMTSASVAAEVGDRLGSVVFVDAFYPDAGESALDQMPAPFRDSFRARAETEGEGWRLPATDALLDIWGLVDEPDRTWVASRLTDWSLRCFESRSTHGPSTLAGVPQWFVHGTADYPARDAFGAMADRARARGATVVGAEGGHDIMIEHPDGALLDVVISALEA